jgi:hypothetical protein
VVAFLSRLPSEAGEVAAKGVRMIIIYPGVGQDEKGIWTSPDGKAGVSFFHDPDGNGLSLTQS